MNHDFNQQPLCIFPKGAVVELSLKIKTSLDKLTQTIATESSKDCHG